MGRLILVRHGETDKNASNSLHLINDPVLLNKTGASQIKKTIDRLREFSPTKIYTSKEKRAIDSAEILSKGLSVPYKVIDGLQERNVGIFAGKQWGVVKKILNKMSIKDRYNYTPPEGESWKDLNKRLVKVIKRIMEENMDKTVVVVTHGGVIRALMPYLLNKPKEESFRHNPDNASLTIFDFDEKGFYKVAANDTDHLSSE